MPKVLLDSDLLSELLKQVNRTVVANAEAYERMHSAYSFTSLTTLEVLSGLEHIQASAKIKRAETLFRLNEEIVPTVEDFRLAGQIIGALYRAGNPIGFIDPATAACAIRRGYGVASGNTAHFEFIRRLGYAFHLENWRDP